MQVHELKVVFFHHSRMRDYTSNLGFFDRHKSQFRVMA